MAFNMYKCINRHPSGSTLNRRVENKAFINTITVLYYIPRICTCVNVIILVTGRYKIVFLFFNHSSCLPCEITYSYIVHANINNIILTLLLNERRSNDRIFMYQCIHFIIKIPNGLYYIATRSFNVTIYSH